MKKLVLVLSAVLVAAALISSCSMAKGELAKITFSTTMKVLQEGKIPESDMDSITSSLSENGLSKEAQSDLKDALLTVLSKISYKVNSCKPDNNDKNLYILNADINTVDGNAIFFNDATIDKMINDITDKIVSGDYDETILEQDMMDYYFAQVLSESKAAEATKSENIDFLMRYNEGEGFSIDNADVFIKVMGLNENFADSFQQKIDEKVQSALTELGGNTERIMAPYMDKLQKAIDDANESMQGTMSADITLDGNTIVVTYTVLDGSAGFTKDSIAQTMLSQEDVYMENAKKLQDAGIRDAAIQIKWIGADGSELYNKTFR